MHTRRRGRADEGVVFLHQENFSAPSTLGLLRLMLTVLAISALQISSPLASSERLLLAW